MAWALVKRVFKKYPLVANCGVYGTLYVGAEFSQQTINKKFLVWISKKVFLSFCRFSVDAPLRVCLIYCCLSAGP